jgi:DNA-binding Lrp family transcriptional regulator
MMNQQNGELRGYALLTVEPGAERRFFSGLYDIPEVKDTYFIVDGYEYLVTVKGKGPEDLAEIMMHKIRTLPGIERMATYIEGRHLHLA